MSLKSVLALGLFGRLSILAVPRKDVFRGIKDNVYFQNLSEHPSAQTQVMESLKPEVVLVRALPALLLDLSSLIDAMVLSDEILDFAGYEPDRYYYADRPFVFFLTKLWVEEANRLHSIVFDGIPSTYVLNRNRRLRDAEMILTLPAEDVPPTLIVEALKPNGIDYPRLDELRTFWGEEVGGWGTQEEYADAQRKILEYVDAYVGEDWQMYRSTVRPEVHWPTELRTFPHVNFDLPERQQTLVKLGLFSELDLALEQATLGVSSLPVGSYYPLLAMQPHVFRSSLKEITAQSYQKRLREDLERFGVACLELEIPPFLRFCLHGAKDLFEVLENAVRLHKDRRIIDLRRHLQEIAHTTDPVKLRRYLLRLEGYIQASLDGLAGLAPAGLGVSTNGESLSLSLSAAAISATRRLLAWKNPVVVMHTHLQRVLAEADSVGDLARILQVPRAVAAKAVQDTKKLQAL